MEIAPLPESAAVVLDLEVLLHGLFYRHRHGDGCAHHRVVAHADQPIISTCAGTDDDPANCAYECILPMVSVMP